MTGPATAPAMDEGLQARARAAKGFMPDDEGLALYAAGVRAARTGLGPLLEVGSYCGKSALYLGAAARAGGTALFSVDHHRGSEENQAGWEHHDPTLVDPVTKRMDTLPVFRATVAGAGLEDAVVAVVGESATVARHWSTPLALLFIDGGHGAEPAWADWRGWSPRVAVGGFVAIHDVFPDPADGGRPPYELFMHALNSGCFTEEEGCGSLRVLRRTAPGGA
ncbi:MAG TPA: class I SAM-dependent methyltransferase [Acidimicrobiales bacterium]|nr:class I SAM-dependent methyltransferase [Acidimicrobiales bacterium]